MAVIARPATPGDADAMAGILRATVDITKRCTDPYHVRAHCIDHPDRVEGSLAVDADGAILGFRSLRRASAANRYEVPERRGVVGTHVLPNEARRGVAASLFAATGFADWRHRLGSVCERFDRAVPEGMSRC